MKRMIPIATAIALFGMAHTAHAQFDFGRAIRGTVRDFTQNVQREVQDRVQNGRLPRYEVLPWQPPVIGRPVIGQPILEPPRCEAPPIIVRPIHQPIQPPVSGEIVPGNRAENDPEPAPLPEVELGTTVAIEGRGFGEDPGTVFLKIDSLILQAKLVDWNDELAEAQMPQIPLAEAVKATLFVLTANEEITVQKDLLLLPPAPESAGEGDAEESIDLPVVTAGQELTLEGELGAEAGRVELQVGQLRLQVQVLDWSETETNIRLPQMDVAEPARAKLIIFRADGEPADEIEVRISANS